MNLARAQKLRTRRWFALSDGGPATPARLDLDGVIGASFCGDGQSSQQVVKALHALQAPSIEVHINSPGGSVDDGLAIYNCINALNRAGKRVEVYIDGVAASIASVIAMAGDRIHICENALVMVHHPWTFAGGNAANMRAAAADLDKQTERLVKIYQDRTGQPRLKILELMTGAEGADGTLLTAQEALDLGFATDLVTNRRAAACVGLGIYNLPRQVLAELEVLELPEPEEGDTPEEQLQTLEEKEALLEQELDDTREEQAELEAEIAPDPEAEPAAADDPEQDPDDPERFARLESRLLAAETEIGRLRAQNARLVGNGLNPLRRPDGSGAYADFEAAKKELGYLEARQRFPHLYAAYMKKAAKPNR